MAYIGLERRGAAAGLDNLGDDGAGGSLVDIGHDDRMPFGGELVRTGAAYPAAGAGHDGGLGRHYAPPFLMTVTAPARSMCATPCAFW